MDNDENICRLCRRETGHLESLHGYREGLPLSVLVMIIVPIRIERSEPSSFPKFICGSCLEVCLSAYKLREDSLLSDRYFRDCVESRANSVSLFDEEPIMSIKQEQSFAEPLPIVQSMQNKRKLKLESTSSSCPPKKSTKLQRNESEFPYKVDFLYKGIRKSAAWGYFGRLAYLNGDIVEDQIDFLFCNICLDENQSLNRYKRDHISTGMIFTHLKAAHGIERTEDYEAVPAPAPKPIMPATPKIQGLKFPCTIDDCDELFSLKICLDIHIGLEHTGIADIEPNNPEYRVEISQSQALKAMAWSYYGPLLNTDSELIDGEHNYCRLCVNDSVLTKYAKSCSTTTLLHHIHDTHLKQKKKRKRFGEGLDLAAIKSFQKSGN